MPKNPTSRGVTVWITGLSASGKSTIAAALFERLSALGRPAYRLDGDEIRTGLCADLDYSEWARVENVRRVGEVARLFADSGMVTIASLISPYASGRQAVRERHAGSGIKFVEVYMATPLRVCEARDPKGLYARARAGVLTGFTGIDAPYEPPTNPDVVLRPEDGTPDVMVEKILAAIAD